MNENINIQAVPSFCLKDIQLAVLRLDDLHPIVSGNKWFKLKYYLQQAQEENADTIASFGGPYSNHLVALAFAAKKYNLQSVGYVRSNEDEPITPTLLEAKQYGMHLKFLGRNNFQLLKSELLENNVTSNTYFVDEGGYGTLGAKGAATILSNEKTNSYNPLGPNKSYDPQDPYTPKRVLRGGSFLCNDSYCSGYRVARRMKSSPDTGLEHTGFRCVKDVTAK